MGVPRPLRRIQAGGRYVRSTPIDAKGRFSIRGLPADRRYFVAAIADRAAADVEDPDLLEGLAARATSCSLNDRERKVINLTVVVPL